MFLGQKALKVPALLLHYNKEERKQKTGQNAAKKLVKKCKGEKKSKKLVKKACKVGGDVVLYLSAKR